MASGTHVYNSQSKQLSLASVYAHERRRAAYKRMVLALMWERAQGYVEHAYKEGGE